jgi:hypothetical protein
MNNPSSKSGPDPKNASLNSRLPGLNELRRIGFSKDALIMALKLYFASSKHQLPAGTVESCNFTTEPDLVVTLGIRNPANGAVSKINVQAPTIAAAMITYCGKVRVPLPRNAEKSLRVDGDQLTLVVQVHAEQTKMFQLDKEG